MDALRTRGVLVGEEVSGGMHPADGGVPVNLIVPEAQLPAKQARPLPLSQTSRSRPISQLPARRLSATASAGPLIASAAAAAAAAAVAITTPCALNFPAQAEAATLPKVPLTDHDVNWLQVIGEGWAAPLKGLPAAVERFRGRPVAVPSPPSAAPPP